MSEASSYQNDRRYSSGTGARLAAKTFRSSLEGGPKAAVLVRFKRVRFKRLATLLLTLLASVLAAGPAAAERTFSAPIDKSEWYLAGSIFECRLTHPIPRFGRAVFFHEAGESLQFYLDADRSPLRAGKAALVVESPHWKPGGGVRDLGYVGVQPGDRPVTLNLRLASQLMDSLVKGLRPTFTRRAEYNDETVRVEVNNVRFNEFYEQYNECVASLLPYNFRQMEKTAIYFDVDKAELTEKGKTAMRRLADYVRADTSVTSIYVDGHADASGRRIFNRRLSKDRAEAVASYLEAVGVPNEKINTRYHGERYPVAANTNKSNKARNRRTSIRLDRGDRPGSLMDFEQQNERLEESTVSSAAGLNDFQDF